MVAEMNIAFGRISKLGAVGFALVGLGALGGCLSDDSDPGSDSGGSGGTAGSGASGGTSGSGANGGTAGSGASGGTSGSGASGGTAGSGPASGGSGGSPPASGTVCAAPVVVAGANPAIADFDNYDGSANLATWSFPLGGDASVGIFAGTFGYGDEPDGFPEAFEMVDGNGSTYALSISDTLAEEYGGGAGLWISECLNATAFSGVSFWVRGNSPTGEAKFSLLMGETTSNTATTPTDAVGTCAGTDAQCIHPSFLFPVTDTWTQVQVAWSALMPGNAAGTSVVPDGRNVWQIQFDVGLAWMPDAAGVYGPTPAEYEFVIDDLTFY